MIERAQDLPGSVELEDHRMEVLVLQSACGDRSYLEVHADLVALRDRRLDHNLDTVREHPCPGRRELTERPAPGVHRVADSHVRLAHEVPLIGVRVPCRERFEARDHLSPIAVVSSSPW